MAKKKFEMGGGYSPIARVFERDAEIAAPLPDTVQLAAPEPAPVEMVEVLEPQPPLPVVTLTPAARRIEHALPDEPARAEMLVAEEEPSTGGKRSTRAGGRLPAVRVECLPEEFADIDALVFNLGRVAGHKLSNNILGRALFRLALEAEEEIRKAVERRPPRPRPANGNAEELARHEDEWQQVIAEAMRGLRVRR